jgi:DegV family protein with EDD domain
MANVKIITDSLADIPPAILEELDITIVPCIVRFGNDEFYDRVSLSPTDFYKRLVSSPVHPKTSQSSPAAFMEIYRHLARNHKEILSLHVSGELSGTLNSAHQAARQTMGAKIKVVDSSLASMALGWVAIMAARAAKEGASLNRVYAVVEDVIPRTHIVAMLDTLEYAKRGGRLGKGAALLGDTLNVKPLISLKRGIVEPIEKVRTTNRALERLVEIVLSSGPIQELAVLHAAAPEYAARLRAMLAKTFPEESIVVSEAGPALGAHTGPGGAGIAWVSGKF